jgi:hypothetical protein
VCANPQCFDVQTTLCNYTQNQPSGRGREGTSVDVWCQQPIKVRFDWAAASFKSWLFILSLCHHLPKFKALFLSTAFLSTKGKQVFFINRIHFPRAILENRSQQPTALMTPSDAKRIASLDAMERIVETVNTVDSLELLAKRILGTEMHNAFRESRKDGFGSYFVQAPVGPFSEAVTHAKHLAKGKEDGLSLKRVATLPLLYVTPTPSLKKQKTAAVYDQAGLMDAIVASSSIASPLRSGLPGTAFVSPLKTYPGVEECRNTIKDRYRDRDTSTNFRGAITVLRNIHQDYKGILVSDDNNPPKLHWLYPCSSCKSDCIGFALLSRRSRLPQSHCSECRAESRKEKINRWKRSKKKTLFTRQQSINSMNENEAKRALERSNSQLRLSKQRVVRLKRHLAKKSPAVDFKDKGTAIKVVKAVFKYMSSLKATDAVATILRAMMEELHGEHRITIDAKADREEYADFIASDIKNACNKFGGNQGGGRFINRNLLQSMAGKEFEGFHSHG